MNQIIEKEATGTERRRHRKEDRPRKSSSSERPMKVVETWSKRRRERGGNLEKRGHLIKRQNITGVLEKARRYNI
jgi:hypothetical protein